MIKKVNDSMYTGKFITFEKTVYPLGAKTPNPFFWEVLNTKDGTRLGYIEWFKKWKKFAFFNYSDHCVFEEICLGDISEFLVARTSERNIAEKEISEIKDKPFVPLSSK
jgi:hypothetical protein